MGVWNRRRVRAAANVVAAALPSRHRNPCVMDRLESRTLMSAVNSFTLINADTDQPISTLTSGTVLNLATLPTTHLNVRANVTGPQESVKFGYDGNTNFKLENGAPYALASNSGTDYYAWTPKVGTHTLSATPYSLDNAAGVAGTGLAVTFSVISSSVSPPPPVSPPPVSPPPVSPPPPVSGAHHYLYAFDAPKNKKGFYTLKRQIEVFDIDNGHKWVKNIPIPATIYDIRGVAASPATDKLYISYFNTPRIGLQTGGLLCMDLNTNKVVWQKNYSAAVIQSVDRFDITPNGKTIYMPSGEDGTDSAWAVIDAATGNVTNRVPFVSSGHNTIVSLDGTRAFLEGQEKGTQPPGLTHMVGVVDTATNQIIKTVGPFRDVVRPFTINGKATLVFATVNNFIGFQVADVATGKVIYTKATPGVSQPKMLSLAGHSHGIALSSDEKQLFLSDTDHGEISVWNVAGVGNGVEPTLITRIKVRKPGYNLAGQADPAASNDAGSVPSWLGESIDGRYIYAEGGEIIDTRADRIIGQFRSKTTDSSGNLVWAPYTHTRFYLEIDFQNGQAVKTSNQFGVGRVTS